MVIDLDTSSLGLGEAGVKVNPKNGKIIVNDREQSSSNNVYAIGDVIDGGLELTPVAIQVREIYVGKSINAGFFCAESIQVLGKKMRDKAVLAF